jgi:hypothetical protein
MKNLILLLGFGLFLFASCTKREQGIPSVISNVTFTPCVQSDGAKHHNGETFSGTVDLKFVNGGIQIMHRDFHVHCNFTTVNVNYTFVNGVLNITQSCDGDSRCMCNTDVSYTINGISQNQVNVIFINGEQVYCWNDNGNSGNVDLKIGEITEIKLGETAKNSRLGLSLRFEDLSDSRCPTNAVCVWAGMADVRLRLTTKTGEYVFALGKEGLGGPSCDGVVIEGMRYYLEDVLPYPSANEEQPIKTAKILVTEVNNSSNCDQKAIVSLSGFENIPNHRVVINNVIREGNCLKINFSASGCSGDTWVVNLIAVPSVAAVVPPEFAVRLSLNNPEECEAWINREMSFNLENLQRFNQNIGRVRLNIEGYGSFLWEF